MGSGGILPEAIDSERCQTYLKRIRIRSFGFGMRTRGGSFGWRRRRRRRLLSAGSEGPHGSPSGLAGSERASARSAEESALSYHATRVTATRRVTQRSVGGVNARVTITMGVPLPKQLGNNRDLHLKLIFREVGIPSLAFAPPYFARLVFLGKDC